MSIEQINWILQFSFCLSQKSKLQ